jgi:hypothetical protein
MVSALVLRFLFPKGAWLWRAVLLFGFIFLDLLVTVMLCETPYAEALFSVPIYAILVLDSHLIRYTGQYSLIAELFVDITLGWLIAGAHFNGALSWLWDAPHLIRQTLGFGFYIAVAIPMFYLRPKPVLPRSLPEPNMQ